MKEKTIEQTLEIIKRAHAGQTYGNNPYWMHPYEVMQNLPNDAPHDVKLAALLHDVVEDTSISISDLKTAGYSSYTIWLVEQLTRSDRSITYMDYIKKIANTNDKWLINIKLIDNKINLKSRPEMHSRYSKSISLLSKQLENNDI